MRIDPRHLRLIAVEALLRDTSKSKTKPGWTPDITAQEMCAEMVAYDLQQAKHNALLKQHGYNVIVSVE